MALNSADRTVYIDIKANTTSAEKSLKNTTQKLTGLSGSSNDTTQAVNSMTSALKKLTGINVAKMAIDFSSIKKSSFALMLNWDRVKRDSKGFATQIKNVGSMLKNS